MLKWAMRIVAVGGAMLAMAVGTAAWMHRTQGRAWIFATPTVWSGVIISPRYLEMFGWKRQEADPGEAFGVRRYGVVSTAYDNADTKPSFKFDVGAADYGLYWHGFGVVRGRNLVAAGFRLPSNAEVLCPTWVMIAALLLPMVLWAGIGWRQLRRGQRFDCCFDVSQRIHYSNNSPRTSQIQPRLAQWTLPRCGG